MLLEGLSEPIFPGRRDTGATRHFSPSHSGGLEAREEVGGCRDISLGISPRISGGCQVGHLSLEGLKQQAPNLCTINSLGLGFMTEDRCGDSHYPVTSDLSSDVHPY